MTLEEAQAEILRLQKENATLTTEKENYTQRVSELESENEKVRELNQKYFLELSAQYKPKPDSEDDEDEKEVQSCEEFAKTLTI